MVTQLLDGVYWVGVVDWGLRHFHGHELTTPRGSTYNSYLILDDRTAVVDTVWGPFAAEYVANLRRVVDLDKIDYVIANHAESDHSGSLPALMGLCPRAKVVVSKRGLESVHGHYHQDWDFLAVKTGDTLNLGKCELTFVEAPMLHWPDSMFTYVAGKNLLLSNDAFGQHYATAFRFNDVVDENVLYEEALRYYANILTPFSDFIIKKIDEVVALNLAVDMIAPSHGVIWRRDPLQIVHRYREWAEQKGEPRAVVIYETMWEGTRRLAEAVGAGLAAEGIPYTIFRAAVSDRNGVLTEIFKSKAVVVGSPTVNKGYLSALAPIMEDIRGLRFKNKIGAAFGCYGWSGEAPKELEEQLSRAGFEIAAPYVRAKWNPKPDELEAAEKLGYAIAAAVKTALSL